MKLKRIKHAVTVIVFAVILSVAVYVPASELEEIEKEQQELKEQQKEIQEKQEEVKQKQELLKKENEELSEEKKELENSLGDLNSNLYNLTASMEELQRQTDQLELEIQETSLRLEESKQMVQMQYEDMKLRIQYMYENSMESPINTFVKTRSFAEMLNRVEYMAQLNLYDRKMLEKYEKTLDEVAAFQQELQEKSDHLQETKESLKEKEAGLLTSIQEAKNHIDAANSQLNENENAIEQQQQEAVRIQEKIAAMEVYEKKLEEKRAAEEAELLKEQARLEEIRRQEEEAAANRKPVTASASEEELLAALIYCESGGESYESQLAVGSVVLNRVNSQHFPNAIAEVIYQNQQFTPAGSGKLALVLENGLTTDSCRNAAKEVLNGTRTGNWLYFRVNNGLINGTIIGKQVFY